MDVDFSEDEGKLPSEIEEAMEATTPGTTADITLLDIIKKYNREAIDFATDLTSEAKGSDFDIDKEVITDRKPPEIPF